MPREDNHFSKKRLLADLREIFENPVLNISAEPLDDDLFEWHCNIQGSIGSNLDGIIFHLILRVPQTYPNEPPQLFICSSFSHPNITNRLVKGAYPVCLDILSSNLGWVSDNIVEDGKYSWSSAYSILSILLQTQSLLMDEDAQLMKGKSIDDVKKHTRNYKCECGHNVREKKVLPAFPKPEDCSRSLTVIRKPPILKPHFVRQIVSVNNNNNINNNNNNNNNNSRSNITIVENKSINKNQNGEKKEQPKSDQVVNQSAPKVEDEWFVVRGRKKFIPSTVVEQEKEAIKKKQSEIAKKREEANKKKNEFFENKLGNKKKIEEEKAKKEEEERNKELEKKKIQNSSYIPGGKVITKSYKKNLKRRAKKTGTTVSDPSVTPSQSLTVVEKKQEIKEEPDFEIVSGKNKNRSANKITKVEAPDHFSSSEILIIEHRELSEEELQEAMGAFGMLPDELILRIFSYLSPPDLFTCCCLSVGIKKIAEDGWLWKDLLSLYYPSSQFTAENFHDWKYVFEMELNAISYEMRCFNTRLSFEEDVIGYPIIYTVNPKTELVDYITTTFDLISSTAFNQIKLRRGTNGEKFANWLPIYITQNHFKRALPHIKKTITQLCPDWRTNTFDPLMVLDVLPKLMNTMVVLVCDKGLHFSQKALEGYCAIHRLFIALVEEYPILNKVIHKRISDFILKEDARIKENLPSLGNFLPLLSVCPTISWKKVSQLYLNENFDRNVIWACREYSSLSNTSDKGVNIERLDRTWETTKVSNRLLMFHVYFLTRVAHPEQIDRVARNYDRFYGRPTSQQSSAFQNHVKRILSADNWPEYFKLVGMNCPSKEYLSDWLRKSVKNSLRKRYHRKDTNFSTIHRSGTSVILSKGESYVASDKLDEIVLSLGWNFERTTYLDATVVLATREDITTFVDFSHVSYYVHQDVILHSGDIITGNSGEHIVHIKLKAIPNHIQNLFCCISNWSQPTLNTVSSPWVRLTEKSTNAQLCDYTLQGNDNLNHRAILMCRITRHLHSWKVVAIGAPSDGSAHDEESYAPLFATCKKYLNK